MQESSEISNKLKRYINILYNMEDIPKIGNRLKNHCNAELTKACRKGDIVKVLSCIGDGADDWVKAEGDAILHGHKEIALLMRIKYMQQKNHLPSKL